MVRTPRLWTLGLLAAATLLPAACAKKHKGGSTDNGSGGGVAGGGAGGGTITVQSVDGATVTASNSALTTPGKLNLIANSGASLVDYDNDQGHFYTDDRAMGPLQSVQTILCFVSKIGFNDDHVVNKGAYIAQFDMNSCDNGGGGGSSSTNPPKMVNVIVDAKRDASKPLTASVWFDMADGGGGGGPNPTQRYNIAVAVAEGPSLVNPFGVFRITFAYGILGDDGVTVTPTGHGQVEAKRDAGLNPIVTYFEKMDQKVGAAEQTQNDAAAVRLVFKDGQVHGGFANLTMDESRTGTGNGDGEQKGSFRLAFDDKLWSTHDVVANQDSCRDQSQFNENVYQYGIYNVADKSRLKMKGGFPVVYTDAAGKKRHGYASYYGLNGEGGQSIPAGTSVTQDLPPNSPTKPATYTVVAGPGKLTKSTRMVVALAKIDGIELQAMGQTQQRVVYNAAAGAFQVTGTMANGNNGGGNGGPQWTDVTPPTTYSFAPTQNSFNQPGNRFFSNSLGGQVIVDVDANYAPTGSVSIFQQQDVTGSAGNLTLYCLQQCVQGNLTAAMVGNAWNGQSPSPFFLPPAQNGQQNAWNPWPYASAPAYTFNQAGYKLVDSNGNSVALAAGVQLSNNQMAPNMTLVDAATLAAMQSGNIQAFEASSQAVSYSWNVGSPSNPWSMYQGLVDAGGAPAKFDPPVLIKYTHTQANDATGATTSKAFGKTFYLQFDGSNLMVPGHQDSDSGFWVSDFSIKAGATDDTGAYLIKPLQGTRYMKSTDASKCAALDTTAVPALPDASSYDASKENQEARPSPDALTTLFVNGSYVGPA